MRVVFLGSSEFCEPTLRWLKSSDYEISLVITQPARKAGRGRKVRSTPVAALARELGMECVSAEDVNDPAFVKRIKDTGAHVGLVIAFGQKLGNDLLASLPGGFINLHASLLPKFRGAAPINWAIAAGEEKTGCTVFKIVEKMDAGPMLASRWTYIKPGETAGELHDRLAGVGVDAVQAALQLFEGGAVPEGELQNESQVSLAPKLTKRMGNVDFSKPAEDVLRHVAAMTPWPGARARYTARDGRWEDVALERVRAVEAPGGGKAEPGTIDERLHVAAADGFIELLELKPSSGRLMTWQEYVNGRRVSAGDRFEMPS